MKVLCEVRWQADEQPDDENIVYERGQYFLLHWGSTYKIIDMEDGRLAVANYSVGICQSCKTGDVEMFIPDQIKIIGAEIK